MRRALPAVVAALSLAGCGVVADAERARTAHRLLFDRQDPRLCADRQGGCPRPVPGHLQRRVAYCALQRAGAAWRDPDPALPATRMSFAAILAVHHGRIMHERAGAQRRPAPDPADEDAAAARLAALFDRAVEPCVAEAPR